MSSFGTLIGIGIIGLGAIFIIPRVLESSTDKQKREQEEKKRGEKGAIANTLDFAFGEGFASKIGLSNVIPDLDNFNQQRKEKEQKHTVSWFVVLPLLVRRFLQLEEEKVEHKLL